MSLTGSGQVIQVNGAHFSIADTTKSLRSKTIILDSTSGTGAPTITSLNGNVHTTSNINAGYYHGNAKHLTKTTDATDGTYGSSTAIPAITITNGRVASIGTNSIDVSLQALRVLVIQLQIRLSLMPQELHL